MVADNSNHESLTPRPPSQGRYSPANNHTHHGSHASTGPATLLIPRSPSLHAMVASPPLSPRPGHGSNHSRTPSFSSNVDIVDLLASQAVNGSRPPAKDWTKIHLGELVQGQKLVFLDGDTPVEEACQVHPCLERARVTGRCWLIRI